MQGHARDIRMPASTAAGGREAPFHQRTLEALRHLPLHSRKRLIGFRLGRRRRFPTNRPIKKLGYRFRQPCHEVGHGFQVLVLAVVDIQDDATVIRLKNGADGLHAADAMRTLYKTPIVFCTGYGDPDTIWRIRRVSRTECLFKPVRPQELRDAILRAYDIAEDGDYFCV